MQDRWLRLVTHTEWGEEAKGKHHEGPPAGRLIVSSLSTVPDWEVASCLLAGLWDYVPGLRCSCSPLLLFCLTPSPTSLLFGVVVLA
jgi:hypothetical protein